MKLFSKGPDGRYTIETLLIAIIVPLPLLLLIYAFLREAFKVEFFIAFAGIILFWILWLPSIWKGTYYERIPSQRLDMFYQLAANALLFIYTAAVIFMLRDTVISKIETSKAAMYAVSLVFSYSLWFLGGKIKNSFSPPRDRWTNRLKVDDHSPYAYLLRAFTGFIALVIVLIISGLLYIIVN